MNRPEHLKSAGNDAENVECIGASFLLEFAQPTAA